MQYFPQPFKIDDHTNEKWASFALKHKPRHYGNIFFGWKGQRPPQKRGCERWTLKMDLKTKGINVDDYGWVCTNVGMVYM
jgi:hypothetical protein